MLSPGLGDVQALPAPARGEPAKCPRVPPAPGAQRAGTAGDVVLQPTSSDLVGFLQKWAAFRLGLNLV